jgi:hypothetical protein
MRSILIVTFSVSLAGCTVPPCFESCPLFDPAQYGCGPRVPYCASPSANPGCASCGAAANWGPPIYGYPPSGGLMWGQPAVAPAGCMGGIPDPQLAASTASPGLAATVSTWPQATGVQTTCF